MDAGGDERRGGDLCLQVGDAGLGGLILLLLTARPGPGDGAARGEPPEPDAVRQRVAERGAALHALLRHRHQLRLARDFARRLKASSDFLRQLLAAPGPGEPGEPSPALRELCLELRAHAGHWAALLRRLRTDSWLQALPQRRGEAVAHMRRALLLPALMATRLAGRRIEGRLRALGRPCTPSPDSESLADLFQGLEIYNRVLGQCVAVVAAAHAWLTGRAGRYLAAWALPQFLLLTQGDLQVLKAEAEQLMVQVSQTFPEPEDIPGDSPPEPLPSPGSPWELQLCRQIRDVSNSIQLFSRDVLWMFSTSCKRLSAEIFDQTMPLGRHWRLRPRAELPSSPSAYAAAAVQAVLGQVLQGAQTLPHDAQVPTLARVTTAFLEAWMDHILTRRIKFSLQGALQLRRDFEAVRELVCSESSGLAPEARQALQALCIFRHTDTAVRCLLQQPGGLGRPPRGWGSLRRCCSDEGAHPLEPSLDPLPDLDRLEGPGPIPGTPPLAPEADLPSRPESPFPGSQQQWLSLRLHRARRWRVPGLPCVGNSPEG
ncbi:hypothetical protein DUI87_09690 [Hirundo rustica rustica]|uniref:Coiled-coil protein 142 C-terminal domain-containing protein n=1 Tax=Hirundo rustica rustica TaxID=333673 RepID=A0A3M0KMY7_HIRRU|nr:hypothetical protein DUI87_09690 [Hirundo rustica rustica]